MWNLDMRCPNGCRRRLQGELELGKTKGNEHSPRVPSPGESHPLNSPPTLTLHNLGMFYPSQVSNPKSTSHGLYCKDGDVGSSHKKAIADQIFTLAMRGQVLATKAASRLKTTMVINVKTCQGVRDSKSWDGQKMRGGERFSSSRRTCK